MTRQHKPAGSTAEALIPDDLTQENLKAAAAVCRACPLWERGTQTVFGEGGQHSRLILVGEQPGDVEDREGRPFVGPAGRILDNALEAAGIDRDDAYVTNAVKHFKWIPKGKLRLHQKPNAREIGACLPWLEAEIDLIRPRLVVALGTTAAEALLGPHIRVTQDRGTLQKSTLGPYTVATVHPSSILRTRTDEERHAAMERFVEDLKKVAAILKGKR